MNCKICNKRFNDTIVIPYSLIPCGHTYCYPNCTSKLKACPECDKPIEGKLLNHAVLELINPNPIDSNDATIYFDRYKKVYISFFNLREGFFLKSGGPFC